MKKIKILKNSLLIAGVACVSAPVVTTLTSCGSFATATVIISITTNDAYHNCSTTETIAKASIDTDPNQDFKNWKLTDSKGQDAPDWIQINEDGEITATPTNNYGNYTFYVYAESKSGPNSNRCMLSIKSGPISDDNTYYNYVSNYHFTSSEGFYATALNQNISGDINLISSYNGIDVVFVSGYSECTNISSIILSEHIVEIKDLTFNKCFNLSSVALNENLQYIGSNAFVNCSSLSAISIPNSVKSLGSSCFMLCQNLAEVNFNDNQLIDSISSFCFAGCTNLTKITLPSSITSIGDLAFEDCKSLESIKFQRTTTDWLEDVNSKAFTNCTSLKTIYVPNDSKDQYETALAKCTWAEGLSVVGF